VTLTPEILDRTRAFAERIELANRKRKRKNVQGLTAKGKESLALRVRGLSGEAALASYLGIPPVRFADEWRWRPDVLCFDCITTDKAHGSLIITPRDRLDMMKVLVIDRSPVFHLCGWYRAGDARLEAERSHSEWWRTEREKGGAWYVPQAFLRPLSDDEAQHALAPYSRQWTGTEYKDLTHVRQVEPTEASPFWHDFLASRPKTLTPVDAETGEVITDWREVLRRAGAAPPEHSPPTEDDA